MFTLKVKEAFNFKTHSILFGEANNAYFSGKVKYEDSVLEIRSVFGNEPEKLDKLSFQVVSGNVDSSLNGKILKEVV